MHSTCRRIFSILGLVCVLVGISGINISGAATKSKFTTPSAPLQVRAVGGISRATVTWMAPKGTGGVPIISYTVTYYPWKKSYVCKASSLNCIVPVTNPNKPSTKPTTGIFYFTVYATNSIGSSSESERSPTISVTFPGTTYIAPKSGPATPTPTPIVTPVPTPTSTFANSTHPFVTNAFDGTYTGMVTVNIQVPGAIKTGNVINTSFVIYAGRGSGRADNWSVDGYITDAAGVATITVADATYGSFPFTVNFTQDPVTKAVNGYGKGVHTFNVSGYGNIVVEFFFNVSKAANQ